MTARSYSPETFKFILIGVALILLFKLFVSGQEKDSGPVPESSSAFSQAESHHEIIGPPLSLEIVEEEKTEDAYNILSDAPNIGAPPAPLIITRLPQPEPVPNIRPNTAALPEAPDEVPDAPADIKKIEKEILAWKENAQISPDSFSKKPKIVIIIDDLGLSHKSAKEIADLQGPLTMAFLPYAGGLKETTSYARQKGHELLIHVPMQPLNGKLDPGPVALTTDMSWPDFDKKLAIIFKSFDGYVGINNHMGSRLTQNKPAMKRLMRSLKEKGLLFVDSKTIATSVAADTARNHFVPYGERDVFLDHYTSLEAVRQSLKLTEQIARAKGQAIAIGHPKPRTIQALREWLPTLNEKGFSLVPVSAIIKTPEPLMNAEGKSGTSARLVAHNPVKPALAAESAKPDQTLTMAR